MRTSRLASSPSKSKPLEFHMVGQKYLVHHGISTMIGWTTCGRVHQISGDRKEGHPYVYCCDLGWLNLHGIYVKTLGLSHFKKYLRRR